MDKLNCIWRNLNKGAGMANHVWSVGTPELKANGQPRSHRGKVCGAYGKVPEAAAESVLMFSAEACYAGEGTRRRLQATRKREVFAWFRGVLEDPAAVAEVTHYKRGRRIGMNLRERGEVFFCYADTREPCPATFPALLFTPEGLFEVEFY